MDRGWNFGCIDVTIVQAHQHSAGAKKGAPSEIGHSRGGASAKIHAVVDSYVYPIYLILSEGQRNDCNFAFLVLKHVHLEGCNVLADHGYNGDEQIDYIYTHGAEPTIPSKKMQNLNVTVTGGYIRNII